jgi:hypothetical protein
MAIFRSQVLSWQADSWKRVSGSGTYYCLNTNRVSDIRDGGGDTCTLFYCDNPFDDRDAPHWMKLNKTVASLKNDMDDSVDHAYVTLNIYPENDPTQTPVETTIHIGNFAYSRTDPNSILRSWVTYTEDGWDIKTVLCNDVNTTFVTTDD